MSTRLFDVRARVGCWTVVVLRVDAIDSVDARRHVYRELSDGTQEVVFLACDEVLP